jgi:hypothetical protein
MTHSKQRIAHSSAPFIVILGDDSLLVVHSLTTFQAKAVGAVVSGVNAVGKHVRPRLWIEYVDPLSSIVLRTSVRREDLDGIIDS